MSGLRRRAHDVMAVLTVCGLFAGCGANDSDVATGEDEVMVASEMNTLTPEEQAAGWQLLFDGTSTAGWRGYGEESFPAEGWAVDDGDLIVFEGGIGGDIVTEATFSDFELTFEFKLSPVGNSGVFYRVQEHEGSTLWQVAPEFQVLDDPAYLEMGITPKHFTGDNYDLHSSTVQAARPVGEWNQGRILVEGAHVEHWLNGQMTVAYELWAPEWEALVAESKFAPHEHYGRAREGRIGLQDHDRQIRYRNMKIRPIDP